MSKRSDYIKALRDLAEWLEANQEVPAPEFDERILVPLMVNPAVEQVGESLGLTVEYDKDGNAAAPVKFGPIEYRLYGYADWETWSVQHAEQTARSWADKNGMVIQPRENEAVS